MTDIIINSGNNNGNNNGNNVNNIDYFKLGSLTRRHSIIGCIGFEFANPSPQLFEEDKEEYKQKEDKEECSKKENKECSKKEEQKEENSCAICLEQQEREQTKNLATTPCGHTFCLTCLLSHLKHNNTCPLCRAPIEENSKKPAAPISYDEGVMLLNYELTSLRIEEDIEQFVQNAIEIAGNSPDGSNVRSVIDDLMTMVASFGFNLLYDALCHMHHGEENVDPEWQYEMNGSSEDGSEYSGDDEGSESGDDDDDDESEGNLTTISSSSSSDDDEKDKEDKVWGKMYQLPDID